jgi:hypothetical protein
MSKSTSDRVGFFIEAESSREPRPGRCQIDLLVSLRIRRELGGETEEYVS